MVSTIPKVHYPRKLTGKVRLRKGFLGRLVPQVEYRASVLIGSSLADSGTKWRDADILDILLLGDFEKDYDCNYVESLELNTLEEVKRD